MNRSPLPHGVPCPKCEAKLAGATIYCKDMNCRTWRSFGGEHLHVDCCRCKYVRTTVCADFEGEPVPHVDQINSWLDDMAAEYNDELELDPDWEPSSLDD